MDVLTSILENEWPEFQEEIRDQISHAARTHPFLEGAEGLPLLLDTRVWIGDSVSTSIRHDRFRTEGWIGLKIQDADLFDGEQKEDLWTIHYGRINPRLSSVLYHEFGHFIDAEFNPGFGYSDELRPADPAGQRIQVDLWNAFIDGRLGELAPRTLAWRQGEAGRRGVPAELIERAWRGEMRTYGAMLEEALKLCGGAAAGVEGPGNGK